MTSNDPKTVVVRYVEAARDGMSAVIRDSFAEDAAWEYPGDLPLSGIYRGIDAIVNERIKVKEAELSAKYGSNPDVRAPMPSKFDQLKATPGFKDDSWKTPEGRKANKEARLKKFENVSIH